VFNYNFAELMTYLREMLKQVQ